MSRRLVSYGLAVLACAAVSPSVVALLRHAMEAPGSMNPWLASLGGAGIGVGACLLAEAILRWPSA